MLVPTGVKDTGLTGKYWADVTGEDGSAPEKGTTCLLSLRRIFEFGSNNSSLVLYNIPPGFYPFIEAGTCLHVLAFCITNHDPSMARSWSRNLHQDLAIDRKC